MSAVFRSPPPPYNVGAQRQTLTADSPNHEIVRAISDQARAPVICTKCNGQRHYASTCSLTIRAKAEQIARDGADLWRIVQKEQDEDRRMELQNAISRLLDHHAHNSFHMESKFCPRKPFLGRNPNTNTGETAVGEKRERAPRVPGQEVEVMGF
jgi:hypothetical protein